MSEDVYEAEKIPDKTRGNVIYEKKNAKNRSEPVARTFSPLDKNEATYAEDFLYGLTRASVVLNAVCARDTQISAHTTKVTVITRHLAEVRFSAGLLFLVAQCRRISRARPILAYVHVHRRARTHLHSTRPTWPS